MRQARCPHCGRNPGLGIWEKSGLGPGRTAACRSCGGRVSVSLFLSIGFVAITGWLPLLTLVVAMVLAKTLALGAVASALVALIGFGAGLLPIVLLFHWLVPLEERGD